MKYRFKSSTMLNRININIFTAPANVHRAIRLVERLIQTIQKRLSFMKLACHSNSFKIKESIKSKLYQLRL